MRTRAFTLIELLVVIAIIALLATMTLPRLGGQSRRAFELTVDQLADLLTMYAQRDALSERPAGIWHDVDRNRIVLLVLDNAGDEAADWRPDPFVHPVQLPESIPPDGVSAWSDGDPLDFSRWPLATAPGRQRETLEIELRSEEGFDRTLVLPAHAVRPHELAEGGWFLQPIDLDAAGRSREDW